MENLKLEVGKFYRTRNGQKAECVFCKPEGLGTNRVHQCIVLFECGEFYSYMINGNYVNDGQKRGLDIISEWEETPEDVCKRIGFDPDCLPAWANWIAMIEAGRWFYFENEPEQIRCIFYAETWDGGYIPDEYAPKNYSGDWTNSKFKVK